MTGDGKRTPTKNVGDARAVTESQGQNVAIEKATSQPCHSEVTMTEAEAVTVIDLLTEAKNLCHVVELGRVDLANAEYASDLRHRIERTLR